MGWRVGLSVCLLACVVAVPRSEADEPSTVADIDKAIQQLADEDFRVREAASETLWKAGLKARAALETAAKSSDPERSQRAAAILARVRLGILPDTPPEILKLIKRFRDGSASVRRSVLQQLSRSGQTEAVLALIQSETDKTKQKYLVSAISSDINRVISHLIAERDFDGAEGFLQMAALGGWGITNYAAYLNLRGKSEDEIRRLASGEHSTKSNETMLLLQLLKIKGDFATARSIVEKIAGEDERQRIQLIDPFLFAHRDWKTLSKNRATRVAWRTRTASIDELSFDAAYFKLGGNTEAFEKAIDALKTRSTEKPTETWYCGEALLICDRQADAIELFKKYSPSRAFDLFVAQGNYRDAFKMLNIELPLDDKDIVLVVPPKVGEPAASTAKRLSYFQTRVAVALSRLGEKKQSLRLFERIATALEGKPSSQTMIIAKDMLKSGFEKEALALAAPAIRTKTLPGIPSSVAPFPASRVMPGLFEKRGPAATVCWTRLRKTYPDEKAEQTLARVRRLVSPTRAEFVKDDEFKEFRTAADHALTSTTEELDDATKVGLLRALGELSALRGMTEPSRAYYEKAAEAVPTGAAQLKVGDLYAGEKKWKEAATWYKKSLDSKYQTTLTMFLHGLALKQAGDVKQGEALMQLARMLPLSDTRKRYELYKGLDERGHRALAAKERRLVLRLGSSFDYQANDAAKELGNDLSKTEPLKAADHWQQTALSVLRTNSSFLEVAAYLRLPHVIHKVRARGLLEFGEREAAIRELWLANQALPAEIDLAIEWQSRLRKAKLDKVADELFEKVYAVNDRVTKDFPNSAHHHNATAWLAAKCERREDDALTHAQAAVRIAPESAAYLDTLAEVYFVRGDKQKAIELSRRCIEMDPLSKIYSAQLKRFEQ